MTHVNRPAGAAGARGAGVRRWGLAVVLGAVVLASLGLVVVLGGAPDGAAWEPRARTVETKVPFAGVSGLTWDGERLWVTVDGEGRAHRLDPATGQVERHLEMPARDTGGSAWDGETFYQLAYLENRIYRLDPADGRVLGHLPTPGSGMCSGLTWDGEALWVAAFEEGRLYRVHPTTGEVLEQVSAPFQTTGLTWDGESLWHGVLVGAEDHADAPITGFVQQRGADGVARRAVPLPGVFAGTSDWLPDAPAAERQWWFDGNRNQLVELSFEAPASLGVARRLAALTALAGLVGLLLLAGAGRSPAPAPAPAGDPSAAPAGPGEAAETGARAEEGAGTPAEAPVGTLRLLGRGVALAGLGLWAGGRFALAAAGRLVRGRRREIPRLAGEALCRFLTDGGAAFIKLGQVLSSRPDLLPPSVVEPLKELQDRVPPFHPRHLPVLLEGALGQPAAGDLLRHMDAEPLAAASVAQVYRARLEDGTAVAVKVRRPGVGRRVERDLALLGRVSRAVERLPFLRVVPLGDLVGEVATCVRQQLDFHREAANLERFRTNFSAVERIRLPRPVPELSGDGVLTMELLEDLRRVDDPELPTDDKQAAALAGVKALYKMIFLDGFIHADLHPGNVFVRPWGELALVDAGLVAELEGDDLHHFVDFFSGMVGNDGRACARVVVETASWLSPRYRAAAFEAAMVELIDRHARLRAEEFEVSGFAVQLFDTQRRHGVRGSTRFTMTILSLAVFEGIVKQLHPRLDFQSAARPYLIAARYGRGAVGG